MTEPPPTDEGYFVLHDFRRIDWNAWRDAPERRRNAALEAGRSYLDGRADLETGETAIFAITGHKADLLLLHLRPDLPSIERAERSFEQTDFASFTDQSSSYVSVTEIGGYTVPEYFEDPDSVDAGLRRYMQTKQYPTIPEEVHVSFYPMSKRRDPEYNWYELPFEERAEMMAEHGETGKSYAGSVSQLVSASLGLDDWEWGVTLFANEATALKDIVYEMRFDEATAKYGEFGRFYAGYRFPPADLDAFMMGDSLPMGDAETASDHESASEEDPSHPAHQVGDDAAGSPHTQGQTGEHPENEDAGDTPIREALSDLEVYGGKPHGEDVYARALYSEAEPDVLASEVDGLRANFDHYETHVKTAVYETRGSGPAAVVSLWETESAADTASGYLAELPEVTGRPAAAESGWGTMGLFYTVKPDSREEFLDAFDEVTDLLEDVEGHRETSLLINRADENDLFIASQWDSKSDAMAFFRSERFGETVSMGRDLLVERPRHVFLS